MIRRQPQIIARTAAREPRDELAILRAVFQHINQRGQPGLVAWHTPNENTRNIGQGIRRGVSDVVLLYRGRLYALEIKTGSNRPTVDQLAFIDAINAADGFATWATGLDSALRILEAWGLLSGKSQ